jgi:hypothetical protein
MKKDLHLTNDHNRYLISCLVRYKSKMDFCIIITGMSIPSQHVLSCLMLSQVVLCVPTVVYMCLEWPCENGVFFRDSAGIKRVLYRTLFGCCSDLPGECSGALRRNAKKVRTKSVVIPAQDRTNTGCRLHGVQEKIWGVLFIPGKREGGRQASSFTLNTV